MLVVFVTHPEAKDVSRGHVRALSKKGKESAHEVGTRLLSMLPLLFKEHGIEEVNSIASSPSTRCVETAVLVADILSDIANVDEIVVTEEFKVPLSREAVSGALRKLGSGTAIVALHADLPSVLKKGAIQPSALKDHWLLNRPVIAITNYDPNCSIEEGTLICCEKYNGTDWESILTSQLGLLSH